MYVYIYIYMFISLVPPIYLMTSIDKDADHLEASRRYSPDIFHVIT